LIALDAFLVFGHCRMGTGTRFLGITVIPTRAWIHRQKRDGKAAGYLRNEKMAEAVDALIAVWDGGSKGTKHMIYTAQKRGLTIHVHTIFSPQNSL
jgi:hypothetical protein